MARGGRRAIVRSRVTVTMVAIESSVKVSGNSALFARKSPVVEGRLWKSDGARGNQAAATGWPWRLATQQNVADQG